MPKTNVNCELSQETKKNSVNQHTRSSNSWIEDDKIEFPQWTHETTGYTQSHTSLKLMMMMLPNFMRAYI